MAVITKCSRCGQPCGASAGDALPLCHECQRKSGWKPWDEMTIEEKVEDLNRRLESINLRNRPIG